MDSVMEKVFYAQFTDIHQAYEEYRESIANFPIYDEQPLGFDAWLQMEKDLFASTYHDQYREGKNG